MVKPFIVGMLFSLVAIYLILVVFGCGPAATFLIAFPLGMAVMHGLKALLDKFSDNSFLQSNWFIVILCVLILVPLGWNTYLDLRVGYYKGDYTNQQCSFCGEPADGGVFLSGREAKNYYCDEHFEWVKKRAEEIRNSASESEVWTETQMIVKSKLKAPSTAEFCSMSEARFRQDGRTWKISGYVDAENSFGVKLRNEFFVVITFTDDTHYTIVECDITPQ